MAAVFADPSLPLHLDIGCARGRFLLRMAEVQPGWNYLGVEIREPLVDEANRLAAEAGMTNLHYAFCNAMLWLGKLFDGVPDGRLQMVTIQFPDPWFKKRHAKRRMVNIEMIDTIARHLKRILSFWRKKCLSYFEMINGSARSLSPKTRFR